MLKIIRDYLLKIINDIDAGNSKINEEQEYEVIDMLKRLTDKTEKLSRYQAAQYLNMNLKTFDRYVKMGKIKSGNKIPGFKEKFYLKEDLDKVKEGQK